MSDQNVVKEGWVQKRGEEGSCSHLGQFPPVFYILLMMFYIYLIVNKFHKITQTNSEFISEQVLCVCHSLIRLLPLCHRAPLLSKNMKAHQGAPLMVLSDMFYHYHEHKRTRFILF